MKRRRDNVLLSQRRLQLAGFFRGQNKAWGLGLEQGSGRVMTGLGAVAGEAAGKGAESAGKGQAEGQRAMTLCRGGG